MDLVAGDHLGFQNRSRTANSPNATSAEQQRPRRRPRRAAPRAASGVHRDLDAAAPAAPQTGRRRSATFSVAFERVARSRRSGARTGPGSRPAARAAPVLPARSATSIPARELPLPGAPVLSGGLAPGRDRCGPSSPEAITK